MSAESGVNPEAVAEAFHAFEQGSDVQPLSAAAVSNQTIQESMRLLLMVRAYQVMNACHTYTAHDFTLLPVLDPDHFEACRSMGTSSPSWIRLALSRGRCPLSWTLLYMASPRKTWTGSESLFCYSGSSDSFMPQTYWQMQL